MCSSPQYECTETCWFKNSIGRQYITTRYSTLHVQLVHAYHSQQSLLCYEECVRRPWPNCIIIYSITAVLQYDVLTASTDLSFYTSSLAIIQLQAIQQVYKTQVAYTRKVFCAEKNGQFCAIRFKEILNTSVSNIFVPYITCFLC